MPQGVVSSPLVAGLFLKQGGWIDRECRSEVHVVGSNPIGAAGENFAGSVAQW
jgi:hypothetical protein